MSLIISTLLHSTPTPLLLLLYALYTILFSPLLYVLYYILYHFLLNSPSPVCVVLSCIPHHVLVPFFLGSPNLMAFPQCNSDFPESYYYERTELMAGGTHVVAVVCGAALQP